MDMIDCVAMFEEYSDCVVYGEEDADEALQSAIRRVWESQTDEWQADLYSRIKEVWDRSAIMDRFGNTMGVEVIRG